MRTAGILTFHFADNYGAVMQAYGTVTCLNGIGIDTQIINYCPDHVVNGGNFKLPVSKKNIRADLVILYQKLMKIKSQLINDNGYKENFEKFRRKHLNISENEYKCLEELQAIPPDFDVYITGSDQVWNPSEQYGIDLAYYLDFGKKVTKRVAYAASFGRDKIPDEYHKNISHSLSAFDAISVREKSGVDLVNKLIKCETHWMPDPTFLVDNYDSIINKPSDLTPFMFSYVLRSGKGGVADLQKYIAKKLNVKILTPFNPMKRWKEIGETIYPSPEAWLGYIKYSEFVVTNSFHGTVFSIIFNKPFIVIGLTGKKDGLNERARSLLMKLGLESRLLTEFNNEKVDELMQQPIDWTSVNDKIGKWRLEALTFIKGSVSS